MIRNIAIVVLLAAVVFLSDRLVRIDNQRYVLILGHCAQTGKDPIGLMCESAAGVLGLCPPEATNSPLLSCLARADSGATWPVHFVRAITDQASDVPFWSVK
jgi:hypothetical protein